MHRDHRNWRERRPCLRLRENTKVLISWTSVFLWENNFVAFVNKIKQNEMWADLQNSESPLPLSTLPWSPLCSTWLLVCKEKTFHFVWKDGDIFECFSKNCHYKSLKHLETVFFLWEMVCLDHFISRCQISVAAALKFPWNFKSIAFC